MQLCTAVHRNVVTFSSPEIFNLLGLLADPWTIQPRGSAMHLLGFSKLAGFRVEFNEFCAILETDSLSSLVSLVYLNLVEAKDV